MYIAYCEALCEILAMSNQSKSNQLIRRVIVALFSLTWICWIILIVLAASTWIAIADKIWIALAPIALYKFASVVLFANLAFGFVVSGWVYYRLCLCVIKIATSQIGPKSSGAK